VALFILWKFVFSHIENIYKDRIAKTFCLDEETVRLNEKLNEKITFLNTRIEEARREGQQLKESLIQKAQEEVSREISEARRQAHTFLKKELQIIRNEHDSIKSELQKRMTGFKEELLKKYIN
jgi:F0F1-type ATP synthase membrane subunit b/b'